MQLNQVKREIIQHYMDLAGMVTIDRDPTPESTKNGLMHLGLIITFFKVLGLLDDRDIECFKDTVLSCEEVPGCYDRYPAYGNKPRNNDANAHDDYAGVFGASVLLNLPFAKEILDHGRKNWFIYNNQLPGELVTSKNPFKWAWWAFRARFVSHIVWYYLGNGKMRVMGILLLLTLFVRTVRSSPGSDRLLDYLMVESLASRYVEWRKFRSWFIVKCHLIQSVEDYMHPDHPSVDLAREIIKRA